MNVFAFPGRNRFCQAQLFHGRSSFVEDQSVYVVGKVGETHLRLGAGDTDGLDKRMNG